MKLLRISLFVALLLLLISGCASKTDYSRLGNSATADDRRVLVTFVDKTINRELPGNALDGYRMRGQYNNSGWSERLAHELADRHHIEFVAQWPVTELGVSCVVYEVPKAIALQEVLANLQKDSAVASVQQMNSFHALANTSPSQPYSDPYLHLQSGFKSLGVAELHAVATGRGVRIALIDTGIDLEHPDLKGQINYFENMAPEPDDHNLADIHGTAVAGVLSAHPNNGIGISGIAPDAEVLAFRACWPDQPGTLAARCNTFTLALALNQAIRMESRIINLSLTGPADSLLKLLIEKALDKGIVVIAAAPEHIQNDGFPANIPGVIAVSHSDKTNSPAIIAPGKDILTTVPHQAYDFMTGSSFASPHVAGIAALLLQLHPDWRVTEIKRLFDSHPNLIAANLLDLAR